MSGEDFQSRYATVMDSMLRGAVAETTRLFQTMVDELKKEINAIKQENEELRSKCMDLEEETEPGAATTAACEPSGAGEPPPPPEGASEAPGPTDRRDSAVQCDLVRVEAPLVGQCHSALKLKDVEAKKQPKTPGGAQPLSLEAKKQPKIHGGAQPLSVEAKKQPKIHGGAQPLSVEVKQQPKTHGDAQPPTEDGKPNPVYHLRVIRDKAGQAKPFVKRITIELPKHQPSSSGELSDTPPQLSCERGTQSQASQLVIIRPLPLKEKMEQQSRIIQQIPVTMAVAETSTLDQDGSFIVPLQPPGVQLRTKKNLSEAAATPTKGKKSAAPVCMTKVKVSPQSPSRRSGRTPMKVKSWSSPRRSVDDKADKSPSPRADEIIPVTSPRRGRKPKQSRPSAIKRKVESIMAYLNTDEPPAEEEEEAGIPLADVEEIEECTPLVPALSPGREQSPSKSKQLPVKLDEVTPSSLNETPSVTETVETPSAESAKAPLSAPPRERRMSYPTLQEAMLLVEASNANYAHEATMANKPSVQPTSALPETQHSPLPLTPPNEDDRVPPKTTAPSVTTTTFGLTLRQPIPTPIITFSKSPNVTSKKIIVVPRLISSCAPQAISTLSPTDMSTVITTVVSSQKNSVVSSQKNSLPQATAGEKIPPPSVATAPVETAVATSSQLRSIAPPQRAANSRATTNPSTQFIDPRFPRVIVVPLPLSVLKLRLNSAGNTGRATMSTEKSTVNEEARSTTSKVNSTTTRTEMDTSEVNSAKQLSKTDVSAVDSATPATKTDSPQRSVDDKADKSPSPRVDEIVPVKKRGRPPKQPRPSAMKQKVESNTDEPTAEEEKAGILLVDVEEIEESTVNSASTSTKTDTSLVNSAATSTKTAVDSATSSTETDTDTSAVNSAKQLSKTDVSAVDSATPATKTDSPQRSVDDKADKSPSPRVDEIVPVKKRGRPPKQPRPSAIKQKVESNTDEPTAEEEKAGILLVDVEEIEESAVNSASTSTQTDTSLVNSAATSTKTAVDSATSSTETDTSAVNSAKQLSKTDVSAVDSATPATKTDSQRSVDDKADKSPSPRVDEIVPVKKRGRPPKQPRPSAIKQKVESNTDEPTAEEEKAGILLVDVEEIEESAVNSASTSRKTDTSLVNSAATSTKTAVDSATSSTETDTDTLAVNSAQQLTKTDVTAVDSATKTDSPQCSVDEEADKSPSPRADEIVPVKSSRRGRKPKQPRPSSIKQKVESNTDEPIAEEEEEGIPLVDGEEIEECTLLVPALSPGRGGAATETDGSTVNSATTKTLTSTVNSSAATTDVSSGNSATTKTVTSAVNSADATTETDASQVNSATTSTETDMSPVNSAKQLTKTDVSAVESATSATETDSPQHLVDKAVKSPSPRADEIVPVKSTRRGRKTKQPIKRKVESNTEPTAAEEEAGIPPVDVKEIEESAVISAATTTKTAVDSATSTETDVSAVNSAKQLTKTDASAVDSAIPATKTDSPQHSVDGRKPKQPRPSVIEHKAESNTDEPTAEQEEEEAGIPLVDMEEIEESAVNSAATSTKTDKSQMDSAETSTKTAVSSSTTTKTDNSTVNSATTLTKKDTSKVDSETTSTEMDTDTSAVNSAKQLTAVDSATLSTKTDSPQCSVDDKADKSPSPRVDEIVPVKSTRRGRPPKQPRPSAIKPKVESIMENLNTDEPTAEEEEEAVIPLLEEIEESAVNSAATSTKTDKSQSDTSKVDSATTSTETDTSAVNSAKQLTKTHVSAVDSATPATKTDCPQRSVDDEADKSLSPRADEIVPVKSSKRGRPPKKTRPSAIKRKAESNTDEPTAEEEEPAGIPLVDVEEIEESANSATTKMDTSTVSSATTSTETDMSAVSSAKTSTQTNNAGCETIASTEACSSLKDSTSSTHVQSLVPPSAPPHQKRYPVVRLTRLSLTALQKEMSLVLKTRSLITESCSSEKKDSTLKKHAGSSAPPKVPNIDQEMPGAAAGTSSQVSPASQQDVDTISLTSAQPTEAQSRVDVVPPIVTATVHEKPEEEAVKSAQPTSDSIDDADDDDAEDSPDPCYGWEDSPDIPCIQTCAPPEVTSVFSEKSSAIKSIKQPMASTEENDMVSKTLPPSIKKDNTSDPHLQMTKTQFLSQMAMLPVDHVKKQACSSDAMDTQAEKGDSEQVDTNPRLNRLRSHRRQLKSHKLQPSCTEPNTEILPEPQPTPVPAKKARLVGGETSTEILPDPQPTSVPAKKCKLVEEETPTKTSTEILPEPQTTPVLAKKAILVGEEEETSTEILPDPQPTPIPAKKGKLVGEETPTKSSTEILPDPQPAPIPAKKATLVGEETPTKSSTEILPEPQSTSVLAKKAILAEEEETPTTTSSEILPEPQPTPVPAKKAPIPDKKGKLVGEEETPTTSSSEILPEPQPTPVPAKKAPIPDKKGKLVGEEEAPTTSSSEILPEPQPTPVPAKKAPIPDKKGKLVGEEETPTKSSSEILPEPQPTPVPAKKARLVGEDKTPTIPVSPQRCESTKEVLTQQKANVTQSAFSPTRSSLSKIVAGLKKITSESSSRKPKTPGPTKDGRENSLNETSPLIAKRQRLIGDTVSPKRCRKTGNTAGEEMLPKAADTPNLSKMKKAKTLDQTASEERLPKSADTPKLSKMKKAKTLDQTASEGRLPKAVDTPKLSKMKKVKTLAQKASEERLFKSADTPKLSKMKKAKTLPQKASEERLPKAADTTKLSKMKQVKTLAHTSSEERFPKAADTHKLSKVIKTKTLDRTENSTRSKSENEAKSSQSKIDVDFLIRKAKAKIFLATPRMEASGSTVSKNRTSSINPANTEAQVQTPTNPKRYRSPLMSSASPPRMDFCPSPPAFHVSPSPPPFNFSPSPPPIPFSLSVPPINPKFLTPTSSRPSSPFQMKISPPSSRSSISGKPVLFRAPPIVSPLQPLSVLGRRLLKNQCGQCGRIFATPLTLENHVSLHKDLSPFTCLHCGKGFHDNRALNRHHKQHRDGRVHKCEQCGKGFVYKFTLTKHIQMVHCRIKPFVCQICNKDFSTKEEVTSHIRVHTGETPYHCHLCEKKFKRKMDLNKHLRWHNGEKRYWCPYCDKGFLDSNNLKIHKYTHTGEKPRACPHCPKKFTQTGHLKKHLRTIHKQE